MNIKPATHKIRKESQEVHEVKTFSCMIQISFFQFNVFYYEKNLTVVTLSTIWIAWIYQVCGTFMLSLKKVALKFNEISSLKTMLRKLIVVKHECHGCFCLEYYASIIVFYLQKKIVNNWYFSIASHRKIINDINRHENVDSMKQTSSCMLTFDAAFAAKVVKVDDFTMTRSIISFDYGIYVFRKKMILYLNWTSSTCDSVNFHAVA